MGSVVKTGLILYYKDNMNKQLQQKLILLMQQDQKERKEGSVTEERDKERAEELKKIIKKHGWPMADMVGEEAAEAAWLIAQHADFDISFQKQALKLIQKAVKNDNAPKHHIAYLTDRILVNEEKSQMYGTQFYRNKEGDMVAQPIKSKEQLDSRRKTMNLPPFAEYKKKIEELNKK